MASIKISELNEYTEVQDNDLFPVVDVANGETKKVKATNIGTGGKELIMVGDESVATKNTKLLIETDTLETLGTEVVNSLDGNETAKAPSVQAVNNKFNEISAYSTEEKVIGTWINGKKLYEKTIYINTGSTADTDVVIANLNIDNIEYLKITDGSIFSNNNWWDVNFYYSNTIYAATYIRPEENAIKGKYGSYILGTGYITINYTRTTDSATKTINEEPISEEATI